MTSRRSKFLFIPAAVLLTAGGYFLYSVFANQGQGTLAQAPLNIQSQVTPGFMMAIDDSGSMMFQNQFPGADGKACWNRDNNREPYSFFYTTGADAGEIRVSGGTCNFTSSYGSHYRLADSGNDTYLGIPPVDTNGFARSHEFNPAYFNPSVTYEPWVDSSGASFGNATPTAAKIDPSGNVGTWTVDLTDPVSQTRVATANGQLSDEFRAMTGMVLPTGTRYFSNALTCGGLPGLLIWRELTAPHTMTASCDIFITHYLPTFYLKQGTPVPAGYGAVSRTLVNNACGVGCNMYRYTISAANVDAMQNFANWFSYYGNRHKSLIAGLTRTMYDVNNMRVGYFRISQHASFDNPNVTNALAGAERVTMRNMAVPTDKAAIYTEILRRPGWGSTFNRQAVYAAGQQFKRTDPVGSAAGGAPVQLACQKNAIMLFTDGYSNTDGPAVGNVDAAMGAPFSDAHSNTMADIASMSYMDAAGGVSPLRTDLPAGQVPTPGACPSADLSVDCQSNLHANFYGITLNGRGNLYDPDNVANAYTNAAVYGSWPTRQNDNRSTIDDIWHAATNTRGKLVNARTPADIIAAMRQILGAVGEGTTPAGSIGLTGARIGTGSFVVEPFYEARNFSTDWYSTLTAKRVSKNASTGAVEYTNDWEASTELPLPASRNVWFGKGATVGRFNAAAAGLTLADLCNSPTPMSLCTSASITSDIGVNISQAVTYLLGDQSNEESRGGTGKLRFRTTRLGDIVNSSPVVSNPLDDYGYRTLRSGATTDVYNYQAYLTTKSSRNPMVYAGANDGMLHAFDGRARASGGGVERFAYIPTTALGHMGNLLYPLAGKENDPDFQHRYYVDGPVAISDAYNAGAWRTVLVGGMGAGGRGVYALNVSNPSGFTGTDRLWEINTNHATASVKNNIGHVINKPVIVPVKTYGGAVSWKAIFGNGYGSINRAAVLYVVDIASGAVTTIAATEAAAPAGDNGLGNIVVLDRFGGTDATLASSLRDGYADTVYAADQKGAVWKFDLRDATPAAVTTPFFVTRTYGDSTRQPILGGLTAAAGPGGSVVLYFGTGSFSFAGDEVDQTVQSLYGVLDRGTGTTVTRTSLTEQTVTVVDGSATRVVSNNPGALVNSGWFIDLPPGERMVSNPAIESGVVFIPTYNPNAAAGCTGIGNNWLYGLNALTGGAALNQVRIGAPNAAPTTGGVGALALATGGTAPVKDVAVMATPRLEPLSCAPGSPGCTETPPTIGSACTMVIQVAGAPPIYMPRPCGRQSWRQVR